MPLVTFGIYSIVWFVKTKNELNSRGAGIPTAWLIIVPIAGWYFLFRYFQGAEQVTGRVKGVPLFLAYLVITIISLAIALIGNPQEPGSSLQILNLPLYAAFAGIVAYLQASYNKVAESKIA